MWFKSLKTNIAVNLIILLLLSIALTDFVVLRIIENQLIDERGAATRQWIASVLGASDFLQADAAGEGFYANRPDHLNLVHLSLQAEGGPPQTIYGRAFDPFEDSLSDLARQVIATGRSADRFLGRTWGVFWMQSRYLAVTVPLLPPKTVATAVIDLRPLYQKLRSSQKIVSYYLVVNLIVLLFFGAYRLTRLVTRPIQRLTKLTDAYHPQDRFDVFSIAQTDEFGRLSSALNRMIKRIERDKWMLRQSLDSIETANRELQQAQQEVVRAEKLASTGRLSAGIAHEIGNPIGIVLGYLGLLKNRSLAPETAADYINRAETEINRINSIIRQLLDFSRPSPENASVFSLHRLLHEAGEMLSSQPLMKAIRIQYDLSAACDRIHADYNQLHQVVVNLLINAADSIAGSIGAEAGLIEISTRTAPSDIGSSGPALQLMVHDNGGGISEAAFDKLFDPFFTTKEPGKGTGLGLSVCYMIIERFGGTIAAERKTGGGATMVVTLPLAVPETGPPQRPLNSDEKN